VSLANQSKNPEEVREVTSNGNFKDELKGDGCNSNSIIREATRMIMIM